MPLLERRDKPALYYEIDDYTDPWRDAPYILLQHGFGRSSKFWYPWIPYLSRFYKVVRPDLRGLGRSPKDFDLSKDLTIESYLDDMEAILDALGVASTHYCGEAIGGILGLALAAQRPRRIRTLTIISAPIFLDHEATERAKFGLKSGEDALRTLGPQGYARAKNASDRFPPGTDPGLTEWFAQQQGDSDVEVMIAMQKFAYGLDMRPCLPKIAAPMLAIYPSDAPTTTLEQESLLRVHVRNLSLVHIQSKYRNLHMTQPAACANHVLHFAAQHDGITCRE